MATPLHWSIREGHLSMVVLLMQYGWERINLVFTTVKRVGIHQFVLSLTQGDTSVGVLLFQASQPCMLRPHPVILAPSRITVDTIIKFCSQDLNLVFWMRRPYATNFINGGFGEMRAINAMSRPYSENTGASGTSISRCAQFPILWYIIEEDCSVASLKSSSNQKPCTQ